MEKQITVQKNCSLVKLNGEMYTEDAALFRQDLMKCIATGSKQFIIDMQNLNYIDSLGIAALISVNKSVLSQGGCITLKGLHGTINELFEITRLKSIFTIEE
ncbi:STAS domain-containing protein [Sporomusa aerivorans]|uniref:STAS domain-containing protein n=1 Tax=Sporomusa aerivorans TaxID=204936 RepID=UPI00352A153C